MRKYVMSNGRGYDKATQRVYSQRLREYALKSIEDLVLIAQNTPERVQSQIFNEDVLTPLFRAIFHFKAEISDKEAGAIRPRLLRVFYRLVIAFWSDKLDRKLAPKVYDVLRHSPRYEGALDHLNVIEALFIASLSI